MKWVKIFDEIGKANIAIPENTSKLLIIGDHRICLSNVNNEFYAIKDACPHSGHSLSQGKINYLNEIVCPLHGYRFSLKHGQEGDHKCNDAKTFRVKVDEHGLHLLV
jgi:nitrite reductase/ring-hydroxylating ferredoxin subunit